MSAGVADAAVRYMSLLPQQLGAENIGVSIIGGEPLLAEEIILRIVDHAQADVNGRVSFHVDTNGTRSLKRLFAHAERMTATICLSLPPDHAQMRYRGGKDTSARALEVIGELDPATPDKGVVLRYNAHRTNVGQFEKFVEWVTAMKLPAVQGIRVARLEPYTFNTSFNLSLDQDEYDHWRLTTAIPCLLRHGWPPGEHLIGLRTVCRAYTPGSPKVKHDGSVISCEPLFPDGRSEDGRVLTIDDLCENVDALRAANPRLARHPKDNAECRACDWAFACMGKIGCRSGRCPPDSEFQAYTRLVELVLRQDLPASAALIRAAISASEPVAEQQ